MKNNLAQLKHGQHVVIKACIIAVMLLKKKGSNQVHAKYIFKFKSNYANSKLIITFYEKIFLCKITFR